MEQDNRLREEIENAGEIKKNKGGRPKGKQEYSSCKVTVYLTAKEYELLTEFAKKAWYTFNYSDAARYMILNSLKEWVTKGKKDMRLRIQNPFND
jgi:hypothetical protein